MLLLFDTSTMTAVTALAVPEGRAVVGEKVYLRADGGSAMLLAGAAELLASAGVGLDAVTGIVVNRGPGSYTGLRVSYALAQGLAATRGLPFVGVPAYAAFGEQFRLRQAALCVCFDARSRGVAWLTFPPGETQPLRAGEQGGGGRGTTRLELGSDRVLLQIAPAAAIPGLVPRPCRLVGPGLGAVRRAMDAVPPGDMEFVTGSDRPAPVHLLALGGRRLEEGGEDPVTTSPYYLGTMEAPPAARAAAVRGPRRGTREDADTADTADTEGEDT